MNGKRAQEGYVHWLKKQDKPVYDLFFEIKKALDSQSIENFIDGYDEKLSNEQMIAIMKEVFRQYGLSNKRRKEVLTTLRQ